MDLTSDRALENERELADIQDVLAKLDAVAATVDELPDGSAKQKLQYAVEETKAIASEMREPMGHFG